MRMMHKVVLLAGLAALGLPGIAVASGPTRSPLPGYPRFRGVMLVHNDSSEAAARERAIASALKTASTTSPNCELGENPGADLCFWGGPVVQSHKVHVIFWGGAAGESAFPAGYVSAVKGYFSSVAGASGSIANVYSVGTQYAGSNGEGSYRVSFDPATSGAGHDVAIDSTPFVSECSDPGTSACLTDEEIQAQVTAMRAPNGWPASLEDVFFILTPPNVGSCFTGSSSECAFVTYCAYHGDFGGSPPAVGGQTLYANIPYVTGVEGCDPGEYPVGPGLANPALDTISHEHNETITDPLGSQCVTVSGKKVCEPKSWMDLIGQEIGDKCLPPETFDIYGVPFNREEGFLYNQVIESNHYFLQREWSNTAFAGEGGCVQRMLPAEFAVPTEARATVPVTLDGSASGEAADPATYWVWSFGDGMQTGTPEAKTSHVYAKPGEYAVTLTAFDAFGNSNTHSAKITVGAAPPSTPAPPAPEPITLTKTVTVLVPQEPAAYTASQLASKLGLPANGAKLSGSGRVAIGHAACPPACTVSVRLYAVKHLTVHGRRVVKRVFIGALTTRVAANGSSALALTLNATGRKLLRKTHRLPVQLMVSVTGREGGSWQISRTLTLTR